MHRLKNDEFYWKDWHKMRTRTVKRQPYIMSLRYYDVMEKLLDDLKKWEENESMTKKDILDSTRERVIMLMRHIIITPMIGSAYAYPGDLDLSGLASASVP